MRVRRLLITGLLMVVPVISACGKLGRLERPEARPGEARDVDIGSGPGQTLRNADPRDRNAEPLPPLVAPAAAAAPQDPPER